MKFLRNVSNVFKTPKNDLDEDPIFIPEVKSPADYILVQNRIISETVEVQNTMFIENLRKAGLTVESVDGIKYTDYIFFKLQASDEALKHLATVHGLFPTFQHDKTIPYYTDNCRFFKTPISLKPNFLNPLFSRCSNSVRGQENTTFTSAERISLISCVLTRTKFGKNPNEYGLARLLDRNNFEDAYPLHDGPAEWSESGPLNDRQILAKFWGNWRMFYKFQPIHIIYKYYGSEIAFHYAWLEFYTKFLVIPAVLGLIVFIAGYFDLNFSEEGVQRIHEICNSNMKMCPTCTHEHCEYKELKEYCKIAIAAYFLDNKYTFAFGVFITIWATLYLDLWNREEYTLQYRWNLHRSTRQIDELANYRDRVKNYKKYNKHTQSEEYYTPLCMKIQKYFCSFIVVFGVIIFILLTLAIVLISIHFIKYSIVKYRIELAEKFLRPIMEIYNSLMTIFLMKMYAPRLNKIAKSLTDEEIHRTQDDYLNAYVFKSYVLLFFNSYSMVLYNAFFKDIYYTNPGDHKIYNKIFGIASDLCAPVVGCIINLSTTVTFMMVKNYILVLVYKSYLIVYLIEGCKYIKRKIMRVPFVPILDLPQWEQEFSLPPTCSIFFVSSFSTRVIEYGLVTFFSSTEPFLPLMALFNNIVEMRATAMKLARKSRRNVPKRVLGLGSWKWVLLVVTRMCFVISALINSFTSSFVHRIVYYFEHGNMKGFVNDTVSEFLVEDYRDDMEVRLKEKFPNIDTCFYPGFKNSYNQTHPYKRSSRFYELLAIRLLTVVGYIHVVYFISSVLTYLISKEPTVIKQSLAYDEKIRRTNELDKLYAQSKTV